MVVVAEVDVDGGGAARKSPWTMVVVAEVDDGTRIVATGYSPLTGSGVCDEDGNSLGGKLAIEFQ